MFDDGVKHIVPEGEEKLHRPTGKCICHPLYDSKYLPGIGGAAWYSHRTLIGKVPDTIPEDWE